MGLNALNMRGFVIVVVVFVACQSGVWRPKVKRMRNNLIRLIEIYGSDHGCEGLWLWGVRARDNYMYSPSSG